MARSVVFVACILCACLHALQAFGVEGNEVETRPPPSAPAQPGCYVWMPSGCPGLTYLTQQAWLDFVASVDTSAWKRDEEGELHEEAGWDRSVCEWTRKFAFNSECGTDDVVMLFVPGLQKGDELASDPAQCMRLPDPVAAAPAAPDASAAEEPPSKQMRKAVGTSTWPNEPGCYVLMPTGCPKHQSYTKQWKRDTWAEENAGAGSDQQACEKRKSNFDSWCGSGDTRMVFVPLQSEEPSSSSPFAARKAFVPGSPAIPGEPGCYVWMPTGCPKQQSFRAKLHWKRDTNTTASASQSACEVERQFSFNRWCGTKDAQTFFVPKGTPTGSHVATPVSSTPLVLPPAMQPAKDAPVEPTDPGCYVWIPHGCEKHEFRTQKQWKRDSWGEEHAGAGENRDACEVKRKTSFDSWCGNAHARMLFVPKTELPAGPEANMISESPKMQQPHAPAKPGCYVWMPTGCPNHGSFQASLHWKEDVRGHRAATSRTLCESERKAAFNTWCGSTDAKTLFVPKGMPGP